MKPHHAHTLEQLVSRCKEAFKDEFPTHAKCVTWTDIMDWKSWIDTKGVKALEGMRDNHLFKYQFNYQVGGQVGLKYTQFMSQGDWINNMLPISIKLHTELKYIPFPPRDLALLSEIADALREQVVPCFADPEDEEVRDILIDLEAAWRWGRASGDVLSLELMYASGDDTPDDRTVSSVVTGNAYGVPGALHATHRSLLLFPDSRVVNRQVAVVYDPGNLGYGVTAAFLNGSVDVIDETLTLKLDYALAAAAAQPTDGDRFIGQELNGEVLYRPMPFLWFGAHAAIVRLGTFLEGRVNDDPLPDGRPWVGYLTMTWVHF